MKEKIIISFRQSFLIQAWSIEEKIKLDSMKFKNVCSTKLTIEMKRQAIDWKKVFANYTSEKKTSIQDTLKSPKTQQ